MVMLQWFSGWKMVAKRSQTQIPLGKMFMLVLHTLRYITYITFVVLCQSVIEMRKLTYNNYLREKRENEVK